MMLFLVTIWCCLPAFLKNTITHILPRPSVKQKLMSKFNSWQDWPSIRRSVANWERH